MSASAVSLAAHQLQAAMQKVFRVHAFDYHNLAVCLIRTAEFMEGSNEDILLFCAHLNYAVSLMLRYAHPPGMVYRDIHAIRDMLETCCNTDRPRAWLDGLREALNTRWNGHFDSQAVSAWKTEVEHCQRRVNDWFSQVSQNLTVVRFLS